MTLLKLTINISMTSYSLIISTHNHIIKMTILLLEQLCWTSSNQEQDAHKIYSSLKLINVQIVTHLQIVPRIH